MVPSRNGRNGRSGGPVVGGIEEARVIGRTDQVISHEDWSTTRLLSTAARLWEREVAKTLRATNLSPASLIVLQTLSETETTNQADLAREIHVTAQTLGRTLRTLEAAGYVKRSLRTAGQRDIRVSLTAAGARALTSLRTEKSRGGGSHQMEVEPTNTMPIEALREDLIGLLQNITPRARLTEAQ